MRDPNSIAIGWRWLAPRLAQIGVFVLELQRYCSPVLERWGKEMIIKTPTQK